MRSLADRIEDVIIAIIIGVVGAWIALQVVIALVKVDPSSGQYLWPIFTAGIGVIVFLIRDTTKH